MPSRCSPSRWVRPRPSPSRPARSRDSASTSPARGSRSRCTWPPRLPDACSKRNSWDSHSSSNSSSKLGTEDTRMRSLWSLLLALTGACASAGGGTRPAQEPAPVAAAPAASADSTSVTRPQYPSTYARHPNPPVLIRNATIMTATGQEISHGAILLKDGRIVAVGAKVDAPAPADAVVVDGTGKYVTPGLIDDHSHLGVYAAPGTDAESDGNEATNPVTAEVWAEHSFWPQDPQIPLAIAGGITTIQALPGSANLIGGRSAILKLIPARTVQEMKFPGARYGLKMACGENPKRVYGRRGGPSTPMGNMAGHPAAFIPA